LTKGSYCGGLLLGRLCDFFGQGPVEVVSEELDFERLARNQVAQVRVGDVAFVLVFTLRDVSEG